MLGEIDMGNRKIANVSYGFSQNDAANVQNLNVGLTRKPDINQVILKDGSQFMNANLDMANYKIKILVLLKLIQMPLIKIFLTMKQVKLDGSNHSLSVGF